LKKHIKNVIKAIAFRLPLSIYVPLCYALHKKAIERAQEHGNLRLHLGCGWTILDEWINIDLKRNREILTIRLPGGLRKFGDNSTSYIYSSHFLEHLDYRTEALDFVTECYRLLDDGGVLRVAVPDIEKIINAYTRKNREFFNVQSELHPSWCTTNLDHLMYALQQQGEHKYGYDFETAKILLKKGGFQKIVKSDFKKSDVKELVDIDYWPYTDHNGENLSLFIDAYK